MELKNLSRKVFKIEKCSCFIINNQLGILLYKKKQTKISGLFAYKFLSFLCASAAETRFSVTAESKAMLYIPLQRNTM